MGRRREGRRWRGEEGGEEEGEEGGVGLIR